ncbi:hypothetical protein SERLA73DRAFT_191823 [Serpula lacrymans var. lacrymans S7.3]|uniref:Uncharacterized protein n=2 Tax=Serpula lacrymans var. lacrymans TaxID=341189 RepID=F8QIE3_SERL3|nr:uncharacterized protein SERLADRAFT_467784 [Serpula lacrymans var. lacrymans S7.9]EGN91910.1 hypothetical protein SERLA73DRAFT_191823 [Serpula lacrymans var. lacrymans S7.3]EGO24450.1 hypothetical protein SERLADRAFT_467784 [Serpula lacrymans var. lacrymans S7.9]
MSRKQLNLARLNDIVLGSFAFVPSSETLDHLIRYLSTWSGSDKFLMIIQYAIKLVIPFLNMRSRLQHRAGLRKDTSSYTAQSLKKFDGLISDSKMLWRLWGILPIVQWLISMERNPPPTRKLLTIERLQGWSMLVYYPLEHLYYLRAHELIPAIIPSVASFFNRSSKPTSLNANALSLWSCRFWAIYVFLQFAHLSEDRKLLKLREKNLKKGKGLAPEEKEDIRNRWDAYWNEFIVNVGYLPLTIHWSLEQGLFKDEVWVGLFGLIAGIASFRSGWKATALAPAANLLPAEVPDHTDFSVIEKQDSSITM